MQKNEAVYKSQEKGSKKKHQVKRQENLTRLRTASRVERPRVNSQLKKTKRKEPDIKTDKLDASRVVRPRINSQSEKIGKENSKSIQTNWRSTISRRLTL